MRTRLAVLIGIALAAAPAAAEDVPGPWWLERMQRDLPAESMIRVRGQDGTLVVGRASADSAGIGFARYRDQSSWRQPTSARPDDPITPISWDRIDELHVSRSATTRGALLGGAAGTVVALAIGWAGGYDQDNEMAAVVPAFLIVGGGVTGGWIGSNTTHWQLYYPPNLDDGITPKR